MKDKKTLFICMLILSTLLGSIGQLSFKIGVDATSISTLVLYLICGGVAYGIATLMYLYILGRSNLSWAYGFVGFSYIFTVILAFLILQEPVSPDRWIGVLVIAAGTALIGMS